VHHVSALGAPSLPGQPIGRARHPRLSWLRSLPLLARHVTATMPWTTLIAGCLVGTAVLAVVAHFAGSAHWQLSQGAVRYAFLPAVAALSYVPRAPFRPLTQVATVPSWVGPAGHVLLAGPLLAATCWAQLGIMAHTIPHHAPGYAPAVYPLIAQLTGWCLLAVAAAACVDRSRYADLGGAVAAPVSLAAIALAWYAPVSQRFLVEPPAIAHTVTIAWYAIAVAALALTLAAMRDDWHRYTCSLQRLSRPRRN
jgi:hypothetical protein